MARHARLPAQALVEAAIVVPLLLLLAFGGVGIGRLVQARMGLDAATREAARAAVLSPMPIVRPHGTEAQQHAEEQGRAQGERVAQGYGLTDARFLVQAPAFGPGSWVTAEGTYTVSEVDLPFMRNVFAAILNGRGIQIHARQVERVDAHRSLLP
jgi:hypothetical protein